MTENEDKSQIDEDKTKNLVITNSLKEWGRVFELVVLSTLDSNNWKVSSQGFGGEKRFDWGPDIMTSEEELYESRNDTKIWKRGSIWWQHLLAGGMAGAVSQTCTAPLDTIMLFMQAYGSSGGGKSLTRRLSSKNAPQGSNTLIKSTSKIRYSFVMIMDLYLLCSHLRTMAFLTWFHIVFL